MVPRRLRAVGFFPLVVLLMFSAALPLFAFGSKEVPADITPVNGDYVLCVTDFDASALSQSRQLTGDTVVKKLTGVLLDLSYRMRGEQETAYYRDSAWAKSRADAAKALAAKQNDRDLLIYKGDSAWRYRKNLKTVDDAIAGLTDDLAKIDATAPVVESKPTFTLTDGNKSDTYPAPPKSGDENQFCTDQKADAFLTGTLSEYHGRIYLSIKIYTLYNRSYSYQDSVLFSSEDLNAAMDEISGRLAAAVSGTPPAAIQVHATPSNALVIVDSNHAGRGEMGTATRSPGTAEIVARADNYVPASFSVDLKPGELTDVFIDLTPLSLSAFDVDVPDSPHSRVFVGGLYVGDTPLSLQLPRDSFSYISVETPEGKTASVVYRDNTLVKGNAQFVRKDDTSGSAMLTTKAPVSPEEKRVDKARHAFYTAYGVFWFILPASLLTASIAGTYITANNNYLASPGFDPSSSTYSNIHSTALASTYVQGAAYGVMGVALGVTFFQIFRYLFVSGGDATPIIKAPAPAPAPDSAPAPEAAP